MAGSEDSSTKPNKFVSVFSGTVAGAFSSTVFHPLSVVQTRFQVTPKKGTSITGYQYSSLRNAVTTMVKEEGFGALYQGLTPSLLGNGSAWGIYFLIYNEAKKQWASKHYSETGNASLEQMNQLGPLENMGCACIAGWFTSICTNPIWVIKTRMHIQPYKSTGGYTGIAHAFTTVWKEEGIRGLYRGLLPSFFGVSHGAVQFVVYEELNKVVRTFSKKDSVEFYQSLGTGALSKICATLSTYPYQVVKARLQMRPLKKGDPPPYVGVLNTIKITYRNEGFTGFYRGCGLSILRVTPTSALTLGTYTLISNFLLGK